MDIVGNNVFSKDEEMMARFLKSRNLSKAEIASSMPIPKNTWYIREGKRILDVLIVMPALILLLPVFTLLSFINLVIMGRPVLYKQTRYGYHGMAFEMLKFRSMRDAYDSEGRQLPMEKRLGKWGHFMRKCSLDELPNLFNILKGDMSIIGPRAVPIFFADRMSERHKMMSCVRPGLYCPLMADIKRDENINNYHIEFENNLWYVENVSLRTDVRMLFLLLKEVFNTNDREKHAGALSFFVGYDDNGRAISMRAAKEIYKEFRSGLDMSKMDGGNSDAYDKTV